MTIRLGIGLPAYKGVIASTHAKMWMQVGATLARARERAMPRGIVGGGVAFTGNGEPDIELVMVATVDVCGVERARNLLVANAMKENVDWLIMIDSDTWVDRGGQLVEMVRGAPEDAALVGAAVRVGGDSSGHLNIYRWESFASTGQAYDFRGPLGHHVSVSLAEGGSYQPVDAIGGAVIAINLRRIGNVDFRWAYYPSGSSISEDLYFCRRLRENGEAIYVDTRIKTFHNTRPEVLASS